MATELAQLLGDHDFPVVIVTAAALGERSGCVVGFWCQASIEPLRFTVYLSKLNHSHRIVCGAAQVVVHLLQDTEHERELARLFGGTTGDEIDKFSACGWRPLASGAPLLDGCERWFEGEVMARLDDGGGDHTGLLLRPGSVSDGDYRPLLRSHLDGLTSGHPTR